MDVEKLSISVTTNADKEAQKIQSLADALKQVVSAASGVANIKGVEAVGASAKKAAKEVAPLSEDLQEAIRNATKYQTLVHKAESANARMEKSFKTGNEDSAWKAREQEINATVQAAKELEKSQPTPLSEQAQNFIKTANAADLLRMKISELNAAMQGAFDRGDEAKAVSIRSQILRAEAELEKQTQRTEPVSDSMRNFIETANSADLLRLKLESLREAMNQAFASGDADKAASIRAQMIKVQDALDGVNNSASNAGSSVVSLKSTLQSVGSAFKNLAVAAGSAVKEIAKIATLPLSGFANSLKNAASKASSLFKSLKRIAMYRLLRTAIKEITQAFKEGLKNAYAFSKGIDGTLSKSLDGLASASLKMKNQLGAAFGNLLQLIMPIIMTIINLITQLASAMSALLSAFGGGQYLVAKDVEQGWDAATGAAKKYKNTVLGFDELNKLNDESGGGGGASINPNDMFELGVVPENLKNFADTIKSMIDAGAWESIGGFIAEKINSAVNGMDVESMSESIGTKINNAISAAHGFLERLDFHALAESMYTAFNNIIEQVDFHKLGEVLATKFTVLGEFILTGIETVDWEGLGKSVGDLFRGIFDKVGEWLDTVDWDKAGEDLFTAIDNFFKGLDVDALGSSLWETLKKAVSAAFKFIGGFLRKTSNWITQKDWKDIGKNFYENLKAMFEEIDFASVAKTVFELLGTAFGATVGFLWEFIKGIGQTILDYFNDCIDVYREQFGDTGWSIIYGVLDGIGKAIAGIYWWIQDNIVHPFIEGFCKAFGIASPAKEMESPGENVGKGILEGILKPFKDIFAWIRDNIFDPFVNGFKSLFGIEGDSSSIFSSLGEKIVNGLSSGFKSTWDTFVTKVHGWWDDLKNWFSGRSIDLNANTNIGGDRKLLSGVSFAAAASGGVFPNDGTLFVAGERGAEIVTQMGNHTGVTNVDQMADAVANGNTNVVGAVYAMADAIVAAINNKDSGLNIDGQSVARIMYPYMQNESNRRGGKLVTGGAY